jgi:hypothetical protein
MTFDKKCLFFVLEETLTGSVSPLHVAVEVNDTLKNQHL